MPWRDVASSDPVRMPPQIGEHTEEVLRAFGAVAEPLAR
jgi:crotonobetainyl-CoA:carnitine CoA-transferase CaiB-like acyl-CoA transferase